ncbi:MAG: SMI1/KNR4 family protein [Janthinobacterium lividum]
MRRLSELHLRHTGPILCLETVRAFEDYFQVTLPPSYPRFLSLANGGQPMIDCTFDYTTMFGELVTEADQVKEFGSLTNNNESWSGIRRNTDFLRNVFSGLGRDISVVWIGSSTDGAMIYLDCATSPSPVYALYRECDDTTPKIASSFENFIEGLYYRC